MHLATLFTALLGFSLVSSQPRECRTTTTGKIKNSACRFPFIYEDKTYMKCTLENADDQKPWCSTSVDRDGAHISGRWGHCGAGCPGVDLVSFDEAVKSASGDADIQVLEDYLDDNNPDAETDEYGWTLLISAATSSNTEAVSLLLAAGSDVNAKGADYGYTALIQAALNGHTDTVKMLLENVNIDVNIQNNAGYTALIWAARNGYTDTVKMLLQNVNIDVNIKEVSGYTALFFAAGNGHTDTVKMLLEDSNIDVNIKTNDGDNALGWADNDEIKKMLDNASAECLCVSDECREYRPNNC